MAPTIGLMSSTARNDVGSRDRFEPRRRPLDLREVAHSLTQSGPRKSDPDARANSSIGSERFNLGDTEDQRTGTIAAPTPWV
jgi:hypothetical protein